MATEIMMGDTVRSFDYPGHKELKGEFACFVEGKVIAFEYIEGCERYVILGTRRVYAGVESNMESPIFYPPLNGTPKFASDEVCDGVVKL